MQVEIVGLNKADVLLILYNNAKFAGKPFESQPMLHAKHRENPFGNKEAAEAAIQKAVECNDFDFDDIDLGAGPRPLKVNLSGFDFDSERYDEYHGYDGYASKIIDCLRQVVQVLIEECKDSPKDSMASLLSQIGLTCKSKANSKQQGDSSAHVPSPNA